MACRTPPLRDPCTKPTPPPPNSTLRRYPDGTTVQVERTALLSGRGGARRGRFRVGQAVSVSVSNTGLIVFAALLAGGYYLARKR